MEKIKELTVRFKIVNNPDFIKATIEDLIEHVMDYPAFGSVDVEVGVEEVDDELDR